MSYIEKLMHYCAFQERSHHQVRTKLLELGARGMELEDVIVRLVEQNFLNEERYACAYVRGKFSNNQWGRNKILQGLKQEFISEYCIKKAMKEIDETQYLKTLEALALKKWNLLIKEKNNFTRKRKLIQYLLQKGYEYALISELQFLK